MQLLRQKSTMQTLAVTETITTIAEAEKRFGLSRSSLDFFTEWHNQLSR